MNQNQKRRVNAYKENRRLSRFCLALTCVTIGESLIIVTLLIVK